ncbi:MAG: ATPase, T2SS/T4P/T4SS family [Pyrinomonadaceae bacterium]
MAALKSSVKIEARSRELDFRVSTLPTLFGEKVVLRLLDKENLMLDMTKLGFEPESLVKFQRNITRPYGMVLVTGPTGSGKTNTLYSALQSLNTTETNIMTAEDPVEFNLTGINQVQMKEQIGLNFCGCACARFCARIQTLFSSAKFATLKRQKLPLKRRSLATLCSPRCTRMMRRQPSPA